MHILQRMNLSGLAGANVNDITFGQQKLVGLARALMSQGPLLLLAEPMAGVEGLAHETMREIIREDRSDEHTSELQSLKRMSYAVFCLKKKKTPLNTSQY